MKIRVTVTYFLIGSHYKLFLIEFTDVTKYIKPNLFDLYIFALHGFYSTRLKLKK